MRCATCGTENAPDSRFCGGCGAKLAPASRLAPTAKIPDDASYPSQPPQNVSVPPHGNYASGPASIPPQNHAHAPASIPPQSHAPGSMPPQNAYVPPGSIPPQNNYAGAPGSVPPQNHAYDAPPKSVPPHNSFQRAATPMQTPPPGSLKMPTPPPGSLSFAATPREGDPLPTSQRPPVAAASVAADASRSLVAPPSRPIGLMVVVLLVDLALAGAGAVLLGKGLSEKKPAAKPTQKTQLDSPRQGDAPTNVASNAAGMSNVAASDSEARASNAASSNGAASNVEARASNIETSSGAKVVTVAPQATKPSPSPSTKAATPKAAASPVAAPAPQPITTPPPSASAPPAPAPVPATPAPVPASLAPAPPAAAPAPAPAPKEADVSFDTQLERATTASKAAFDRCAADAGSPHGTVRVAFRVLEDGSVANAFPVEDSTGSPNLGQCLAQTITTWRFTPDPAQRAPINSLRAFNYP